MKPFMPLRLQSHRGGGTLLAALLTITTLSIAVGAFVANVRDRSHIGFQSASWNEASVAAESAADAAVAELRRVMPQMGTQTQNAWVGWTSPTGAVPAGTRIEPGTVLRLTPPALTHGGEGNTMQMAVVEIDAPPGEAPAGLVFQGRQWLRVRAKGSTRIPGPRRASPEKLDVALRRLAFVKEREGGFVAEPRAFRTIEMILRPVMPFQAAMTAGGSVVMSNVDSLADSYDSSDAAKSTSGLYDSSKRQSNGHVRTNGSNFTFLGKIFGDIGTNGGNVSAAPTRFTGAINNNAYSALVPVPAPDWSTSTAVVGTVNNSLAAGTLASPTRFKVGDLTGNLDVTSTGLGAVEIWVTGDFKGKLTVPANVTARIYVAGHLDVRSSDLVNLSRRAENLQIYGIQPAAGVEPPSMRIRLDGQGNASGAGTYAGIYAPGHKVELRNDGDFFGSLTALEVAAIGKARVHFDEALRSAGPIIDYRAVSWVEYIP